MFESSDRSLRVNRVGSEVLSASSCREVEQPPPTNGRAVTARRRYLPGKLMANFLNAVNQSI